MNAVFRYVIQIGMATYNTAADMIDLSGFVVPTVFFEVIERFFSRRRYLAKNHISPAINRFLKLEFW